MAEKANGPVRHWPVTEKAYSELDSTADPRPDIHDLVKAVDVACQAYEGDRPAVLELAERRVQGHGTILGAPGTQDSFSRISHEDLRAQATIRGHASQDRSVYRPGIQEMQQKGTDKPATLGSAEEITVSSLTGTSLKHGAAERIRIAKTETTHINPCPGAHCDATSAPGAGILIHIGNKQSTGSFTHSDSALRADGHTGAAAQTQPVSNGILDRLIHGEPPWSPVQ